MKKALLPLLILLAGISCSPLRKSQVRLMGDYFSTMAEYPSYIRQLNQDVAELSIEWGNLNSALNQSDSLRVVGLVSAISEYEEKLYFPDSIKQSMEFLDNYINEYYILLPNGFDVYKTVKSTSESIVGLFGLKSIVSTVLPDRDGQVQSVNKQKVYDHFHNNQEALYQCLSTIKLFIDQDLMNAIEHADHQLRIDFKRLFLESSKQVSSLDHYFNYNQHFIQSFQRIVLTKKLAFKLSDSIERLLEAENEVARMTAESQKIEKNSKLLNELTNDLEQMRGLVESKQQKY